MSADNAVFIKEIGGGWYVMHDQMPLIENVEYCRRENYKCSLCDGSRTKTHGPSITCATWGTVDAAFRKRGRVFDTKDRAILGAHEMEKAVGYVEYGVIVIDEADYATEAQTLGGESAAPSDDTGDTKSEAK